MSESGNWPHCPLCGEMAPVQRSEEDGMVAECDTSWCEIEVWSPATHGENGSKSIGEVYDDRNSLAIALAVLTDEPAGYYYADDDGSDWPVVWIAPPTGQVSWHVPPSMQPEEVLENHSPAGGYDGHTRDEKNARLLRWAERELQ